MHDDGIHAHTVHEVKSKMISRFPSASRMHDEASAERMHDDKNDRTQTVLDAESTEIPSRVMTATSHDEEFT